MDNDRRLVTEGLHPCYGGVDQGPPNAIGLGIDH